MGTQCSALGRSLPAGKRETSSKDGVGETEGSGRGGKTGRTFGTIDAKRTLSDAGSHRHFGDRKIRVALNQRAKLIEESLGGSEGDHLIARTNSRSPRQARKTDGAVGIEETKTKGNCEGFSSRTHGAGRGVEQT